MDRTILFIFILQLTAILDQSTACWFETAENRTVCYSFIEAAAEAKEEWYSLIVENSDRLLNLKANTFIRMPNLRKLELFHLKNIEVGAFNGLQKLDGLHFTKTELAEIPAAVYEGLQIRILQIYNNPKFKILPPKYFEKIPQIKEVDIRIANIGVIKADIFNNTDIFILYLDRNHIHTIEDNAFADMEGLTRLSLTDNQLKDFQSKRILGKSYSITYFWLNKNQLTKINTELLEGFPVVRNLNLDVNDITYIEPGVFKLTPKLDYLDISNNKLVEISPKIFPQTGSKIFYFFLHNNRLTFLDKTIFYRIPKIHYITYGGNPLQCTCKNEVEEITDRKNMIRLCEDIYSQGERPTCIISDLSSKDCILDVELTANLYDDFIKALEEYQVLRQQCDTTKGASNAQLTDVLRK